MENKWSWKKWTASCKRMKVKHFHMPYTKINLKWIKDQNIIANSVKLSERNIGINIRKLESDNGFLSKKNAHA